MHTTQKTPPSRKEEAMQLMLRLYKEMNKFQKKNDVHYEISLHSLSTDEAQDSREKLYFTIEVDRKHSVLVHSDSDVETALDNLKEALEDE